MPCLRCQQRCTWRLKQRLLDMTERVALEREEACEAHVYKCTTADMHTKIATSQADKSRYQITQFRCLQLVLRRKCFVEQNDCWHEHGWRNA